MTQSVHVTVAICTWNRCESLRTTLEEFCALRVPAGVDWELLVVANNCSDATGEVVESFVGRLPVRLLHEPTPGQSFARNLAIREARGRYLLWTDDDVLVDPNWMTALLTAFERFEATWVFGRSEPEWPGRKPKWYSNRFRGHFAVLDYGPTPFVVTDYEKHFYGLNFGGTVAAHRELGGFRTDFGLKGSGGAGGEDTEMFGRAFQAQMRIVYTPDALVRHVIPEWRVGKRYHRRRQWDGTDVYFAALPELFPKYSWFLGLPRLFYGHALHDLTRYAKGVIARNPSESFYHELRLIRFARLLLEAARHGFRPAPRQSIRTTKRSAEV